jgi:hypothetical protein
MFHLNIDAYYIVAEQLDASGLRQTDATCKMFKKMNANLWEAMGRSVFYGLELPGYGMFEDPADHNDAEQPRRKRLCVDWRGRFRKFGSLVHNFRDPFGPRICNVEQADEVAYGLCYLRRDILTEKPERGIYFEVDVLNNADNISLSVVDFDDGGKSSVTFGPMTGAVLRETKVLEQPGVVQGAYIQPLSKRQEKFMGHMGIYIKNGEIAFFRKVMGEPWETTGFIADLSWAEGTRLTPCLAFRDGGAYNVSVTQVGPTPPITPQRDAKAFKASAWRAFMI